MGTKMIEKSRKADATVCSTEQPRIGASNQNEPTPREKLLELIEEGKELEAKIMTLLEKDTSTDTDDMPSRTVRSTDKQ